MFPEVPHRSATASASARCARACSAASVQARRAEVLTPSSAALRVCALTAITTSTSSHSRNSKTARIARIASAPALRARASSTVLLPSPPFRLCSSSTAASYRSCCRTVLEPLPHSAICFYLFRALEMLRRLATAHQCSCSTRDSEAKGASVAVAHVSTAEKNACSLLCLLIVLLPPFSPALRLTPIPSSFLQRAILSLGGDPHSNVADSRLRPHTPRSHAVSARNHRHVAPDASHFAPQHERNSAAAHAQPRPQRLPPSRTA